MDSNGHSLIFAPTGSQEMEDQQDTSNEPLTEVKIEVECYPEEEEEVINLPRKRKNDGRFVYSCDQCEYEGSTTSLKRHKRSKHEGIRYPCDLCNHLATTPFNLKLHKDSKHEGIRYSCDKCSYTGTKISHLKQHQEAIHEGILYPCDQCEHVATRKSNLKKHKESKHDKIRYYCDSCNFSASAPYYLKVHIKSNHLDINLPAPLPFDDHDNIKEGIVLSCDQCSYTTSRKDTLILHKKSEHMGIRYPCDHCDYVATKLSSLKRHQNSKHENHTNSVLRKYGSECFVKQENIEHLTEDSRVEDFNPLDFVETVEYKEEIAGSTVVNPSDKHEATTTFPCDMCDFIALTVFTLKRHKNSKHEGIRYPCTFCSYNATRSDCLKRHIKLKHEIPVKHEMLDEDINSLETVEEKFEEITDEN